MVFSAVSVADQPMPGATQGAVQGLGGDMSQPLVAVRGFIRLLARDLGAGDYARIPEDLLRISRGVDELEGMLGGLADLAELSERAYESVELDLGQLIEARAAGLGLDVGCLVVSGPMARCRADEAALGLVVEELLRNAQRHAALSSARPLTLTCAAEDSFVHFRLVDHGPGIDPRYLKRIFEPCERLDRGRRGLGLGLTRVRKLVVSQGGQVWIESPGLDLGATVHLRLPSVVAA